MKHLIIAVTAGILLAGAAFADSHRKFKAPIDLINTWYFPSMISRSGAVDDLAADGEKLHGIGSALEHVFS